MLLEPNTKSPRTTHELLSVVGEALDSKTPLFAFGGQTKRNWGAWPAQTSPGLALAMAGINQLVSYEPGDMVVSVQAGCRLADLQRLLAEHGQWLPVDPGHTNATLGGILATGDGGPRRLGYGRLKDHLLGMHVLGPRGQISKSGGRVVKNVAGFDLHRLHVGAFGSLGIIVEATLKVSTQPAHQSAYAVAFDSAAQAHAWLLSVFASNLRPTALELLTGNEAERLLAVEPQLPTAKALAIVGIEGSDAFLQRHQHDLQKLIPNNAAYVFLPSAKTLWQGYAQHLYEQSQFTVLRVGAKPVALPGVLASLPASAHLRISAGLGLARVVLDHNVDAQQTLALTQGLHQQAQAQGGYAIVKSAPLELGARNTLPFVLPADSSSTLQTLSTALKQTWDPNHLMHPGRAPG